MLNASVSGKTSRFKLIKLYDKITSQTLKDEIARRKLSYDLVSEYLYQAFVLDRKSQRKSIAFAFPNCRDHYEITIPYPAKGKNFKASIVQNTYTLIEGEQSNHVEIFSDVWDFLTWMAMMKYKVNKFDAYILNGRNTASKVIEVLRSRANKIRSIMDFTDNESGREVRNHLADLAEEFDIKYGCQDFIFDNYKCLNDYWISESEMHRIWPPK